VRDALASATNSRAKDRGMMTMAMATPTRNWRKSRRGVRGHILVGMLWFVVGLRCWRAWARCSEVAVEFDVADY
jgi:hypothetical protein